MITRRIVWGLIGLAIGAGLSGGCTRNRSGSTTAKVDLAKSAQTALAHTENLEAAEAAPIWKQLVEAAPEDHGLLRNQAVNAVLEYSLRVGQIQGGMLPEAEANRLRQGMQALYETAEQAIGKLAAGQSKSESNDGVPVLWMTAELKRQQSRLLPAAVSGSVRNELVKELLQGLAKEPAPELLGMLLEVIESDNLTTFDDQVADVTAKVAEAHPRNLGVAVEDAIREVMRQGPKAAAKISALADLCSPMAEEIERSLGGSLTDYIAQVQKDLQANDWQTADTSLRSLTNVLRPTQAWRTDQRVLNPHVLDFISVSPLAKLLVASDKQLPVLKMTAADFSKAQAKFSSPVKARALLNVDVDLDDHDELVLLNENQLQVWKHAAGGWELYAATQCAADASLLTWADLFMVDSGSPERFKASRAGLPEEELQRLSRAHDTFVSLVCAGPAGVEVFRVVPAGETPEARLQKPTRPTGMEEVRSVTALSRGDVEGDGDLDLLVGTEQGLEIFINRGNITFYPAAKHSQLPPATSPIVSFTPIDLDRDLDLDIVTLQRDGTIGVLENLLHQQFRFRSFDSWKLSSGGKTWACELNGDASWDLVALDAAGLSWVQTATPAAGAWKIEATKQIKQQGGESLLVADWNFDGWLDSVIGGPQGLRIYLGQSPGEFNNDSIELSKDATTQLELIDFNSDGHLDIAGIDSAGSVVLFENRLKEIGNSIAVRYRGVDDNATGRVNHYAIGSTVELWSPERMYAAVVQQRTTYFGVGRDSQPGTLRAVLTNGSTQHVTQPKLNTVLNEIHVAKGSCPYLYAWNGKEHEFVTDCLWGAPLGLQSSRGKVVKDRPWEFLHLSGRNIQPRDGVYEFWITEELWEVTYLDQVQLMAIDHPADVQVFTNEKVGPPSIAENKLHTFDHLMPVRKALDTHGRDVTETVRAADERYVKGFDYRLRQGLTEPHRLELHLPEVKPNDRVYLVLTGWLMPTDTSLNIQIDQNPELDAVQAPSLWVPDGDQWREAIPFIGFPGGKTKTIVVDLSAVVQTADPRVQVRTSGEFYWDRAEIAINPSEVPIRQQEMPLVTADLQWHGFGELLPRSDSQPHRFDFVNVQHSAKWPPLDGAFTKYGRVTDTLNAWDDQMLVMGPGDGVRLRFKMPNEPLPTGWVRDFVMHNVGWDKDADLSTLTGQSSEPLPFKSMQEYPPVKSDWPHALATEAAQQAELSRRQRFRAFWHRGQPPQKEAIFVDDVYPPL